MGGFSLKTNLYILILISLLLSSCTNVQKIKMQTKANFDWQGHRGARGLFPENTLEGMLFALQYPITTLELDVVISKDGLVVLSHEPWMSEEICLDPIGNPVKELEHNLYKMKYSKIVQFDCGSKIHPRFKNQIKIKTHKPLLKDVMLEVEKKNKKILYNIEIKSSLEAEGKGYQPTYKKFSDLVIKTIKELLPENRYTIQSFDWRVLNYLAEKYPKVNRVALIEEPYNLSEVLKQLSSPPQVFSPNYKLLTQDDISYLQKNGIKVIPWTINDPEDMKKLIQMGVDGIITDYPNLIENL
jgi:glycerophosphoryl diester phosphodiesterase